MNINVLSPEILHHKDIMMWIVYKGSFSFQGLEGHQGVFSEIIHETNRGVSQFTETQWHLLSQTAHAAVDPV